MRGLRMMLASAALLLPVTAIGCEDELTCDDLRAICDACPETPDGIIAEESCRFTLESGDDASCAERISQDAYGKFGCE